MDRIVNLTYSSFIDLSHNDDLQSILFYNEKQSAYRQKIRTAIAESGKPEIIIKDQFLTVRLDAEQYQETLFILEGKEKKNLLGLIIFKIESNIIHLIHLAFKPECSNLKCENGNSVLEESIRMIPHMFQKIKEIKAIKIGYKSRLIKIQKA